MHGVCVLYSRLGKTAVNREGKPTSFVGLAPSLVRAELHPHSAVSLSSDTRRPFICIQRTSQQFSLMGVHFGSSSPWRAHVFSTRVSAWRLPFKADSRGNFTSYRLPLELNFLIAGFEEFTSTIITDYVRNDTLGQGLRGSTVEPLESQFRHDRRFINLCIKDCQFSDFAFLIILDTLFVATIRAFVTSWVAMFIFVFLPPAEPYPGFSGYVSISCIAPFPSAGRLVPMRITQLVYWPIVTL